MFMKIDKGKRHVSVSKRDLDGTDSVHDGRDGDQVPRGESKHHLHGELGIILGLEARK
jgi:hypothetical protein